MIGDLLILRSPNHHVTRSSNLFLAAILVLPILAASHVQAGGPPGRQASRQQTVLERGKADWFAMRTKSAEQQLMAATKSPATAAEAHYWLGRIYDFKGNKAEGAF